jgi:hypothetical protein
MLIVLAQIVVIKANRILKKCQLIKIYVGNRGGAYR